MKEKSVSNLSNNDNNFPELFECQEKILILESQNKHVNAEMVLMQHLARAFQLLDGGK